MEYSEPVEDTVGFVGDGTFLDHTEVHEKYPNNPTRATLIIKHARQFVCPDTNITLYENIVYMSHVGQEKKVRTHVSLKVAQNETEKAVKKPKVANNRGGTGVTADGGNVGGKGGGKGEGNTT